MRPVYATRVEAWPPEDGAGNATLGAPALLDLVGRRAVAWVGGVVTRTDPEARVSGETVGELRISGAPGRWRFEAGAFDNAAGAAWRLDLELVGRPPEGKAGAARPSVPTGDATWRVELTGRAWGESVVLTARIAAGLGAPTDAAPVPSDLFADLATRVQLGVHGDAVTAAPTGFDADDVPDFVDWLFDDTRRLPVVLVSLRQDGTPIVSADWLAARLATLAHVVRFTSFDAAFPFTDAVGKVYSCYLGAARVYWPGFSLQDDPYDHRLWLADALQRSPGAPERIVADPIVAQAAASIGPDREIGAIEAEERRARRATLVASRAAPPEAAPPAELAREAAPSPTAPPAGAAPASAPPTAAGSAPAPPPAAPPPDAAAVPADPGGAVPVPDRAPAASAVPPVLPAPAPAMPPDPAAQIDALAAMYAEDVARLDRRIAELEDALRALQEQVIRDRDRADAQRGGGPRDDRAAPRFGSVVEAVAAAASAFSGPHLVFDQNAFESARKSDFARPDEIYEALSHVSEVARMYHDNDREGLKGGFKAAFAERGQNLRDDISPTTRGHLGEHYTFTWKGKPVVAGPHIGVGGPKPRLGWRVHWYRDEEDRAFVIFHVGRHLPWAGNS